MGLDLSIQAELAKNSISCE